MLPVARSGHAVCAARANSDSHFSCPACGLLHAIAYLAAGKACWNVPTPGIEGLRRPVREDSTGRVLGDVGGTIMHGQCATPRGNYVMHTCHIGVTSWVTNPSGDECWRPREV